MFFTYMRNALTVSSHHKPQYRNFMLSIFNKPNKHFSEMQVKNFWCLNNQHVRHQNKNQPKRFYHDEKKISLLNSKGTGEAHLKDVFLYENDNSKFFKYLTLFSVSQFIFWSYLSHLSYTTMKDNPVTEEEKEDVKKSKKENRPTFIPIWRQLNLGRYKNVLSIFSATVGFLAVCLTTLYTKRSVKTILMKKGGENVMIQFFGPFGNGKQQIFPLSHVSARTSRHSAGSYVTLKLKGLRLYVIVDKSGRFPNKELFDNTVGLRRKWD